MKRLLTWVWKTEPTASESEGYTAAIRLGQRPKRNTGAGDRAPAEQVVRMRGEHTRATPIGAIYSRKPLETHRLPALCPRAGHQRHRRRSDDHRALRPGRR